MGINRNFSISLSSFMKFFALRAVFDASYVSATSRRWPNLQVKFAQIFAKEQLEKFGLSKYRSETNVHATPMSSIWVNDASRKT